MPTALPTATTASPSPVDDLSEDMLRLDQDLLRANEQLARYSEDLKSTLEEQRRRLLLGEQVFRLAKEGLDALPLPVIGVDQGGRIAFVNFAAGMRAPAGGWTIGAAARDVLPAPLAAQFEAGFGQAVQCRLFDCDWLVDIRPLGHGNSRGALISLLPMNPEAALADTNGTA